MPKLGPTRRRAPVSHPTRGLVSMLAFLQVHRCRLSAAGLWRHFGSVDSEYAEREIGGKWGEGSQKTCESGPICCPPAAPACDHSGHDASSSPVASNGGGTRRRSLREGSDGSCGVSAAGQGDDSSTRSCLAARLSDDLTLTSLRQVADAVTVSIGRLAAGSFAKATAQVFGVDPDTADMRTAADRRKEAAITLKVEVSALEEHREKQMCIAIADDLLKRLPANYFRRGPTANPSRHQTSRCLRVCSRTETHTLATIEAQASARRSRAALGDRRNAAGHQALKRSRGDDPCGADPSRGEAERPLSFSQTPLPGTTTSVLGFGDAIGGRGYYQYVDRTKVPDYPILDSFIDTPEHIGDERMFLRVEAREAP